MSSEGRPGSDSEEHRAEVIGELIRAEREMSSVAVMFHSAIAEKRGLSAIETKALDWLDRDGALTAKELVHRSGLAPASVTGLVDRLAKKGYVRRVPHPTDQRRVLIEIIPEGHADMQVLFEDFKHEVQELHSEFTTEELELVARFIGEATRRQRRAAARLRGPGTADGDVDGKADADVGMGVGSGSGSGAGPR
ncbi:MarR family winged helix-turn-helix transcriptional regulator [Streptomyces sp. NPDC048172]|uniref:MarR family winged helix-turn-helix transcriptional regulator n=1 Tax=Streptomyces sp. NPDC048172 TaxID=3365505 RepID=UPI003723B660